MTRLMAEVGILFELEIFYTQLGNQVYTLEVIKFFKEIYTYKSN